MGSWCIGYAKRVVTPPMGVALAGYGLKPERTAAAVLDDLHARAFVFDDGARKAAMVSVEIIGLDATIVANCRAAIERQAEIPGEAVMISAIHSHSAPTAAYFRQWGAMDPAYAGQLEGRIVEAVVDAAATAAPAAFGVAETEVKGVAANRVRKDGPVDHTLRVFAARDPKSNAPRCVGTNFSCHAVTMPVESRYVSADYPGCLLRNIERDHAGAGAAFFQGALGDINPEGTWKGIDAAQEIGRKLAAGTRQALEGATFRAEGDMAFARADCDLPLDLEDARREAIAYLFDGTVRKGHAWLASKGFLRDWAVEILGVLAANPPDRLRCEIQALRIGDLTVVGLPGEIYTLVSETIRAAFPKRKLWIVGFANGVVGYIPDPRDYTEGTYAASMTPKIYGHPPFKPEVWRVMADAAIEVLKKV